MSAALQNELDALSADNRHLRSVIRGMSQVTDLGAAIEIANMVLSETPDDTVTALERELDEAQSYVRELKDQREEAQEDTADEVRGLLKLLADIRQAAGDPRGKLMQLELVAHIREMREVLHQIRTEMRRTGGAIDTHTLGRLQKLSVKPRR